jgi:hypothetical protein
VVGHVSGLVVGGETRCYPERVNTLVLVIWQERFNMSNVRVHYKMATRGQAAPIRRGGGGEDAPLVQGNGEGRSSRRAWEPDWAPRTLVLVLHEEVVNHHPDMAYFSGIFGDGEVSIRALDYIPEGSFLVRATLDLAGFWRMRGFSWYSIVHLVLFCLR